jgi:hypothetical protein
MTHINMGGGGIQPINIEVKNLQAHYCSLEESLDEKSWYNNIKRFIQHQEYPSGASKMDEKTLRRITMNYFLDCEILYERLSDDTFLKCMNEKKQALQEVCGEIYATHANGHTMARQTQRSAYF